MMGRELKVSELKPGVVVILHKEGRPLMSTARVAEVGQNFVHFSLTLVQFFAERTGPEKEQVTDDTGSKIHVYEYLGEI